MYKQILLIRCFVYNLKDKQTYFTSFPFKDMQHGTHIHKLKCQFIYHQLVFINSNQNQYKVNSATKRLCLHTRRTLDTVGIQIFVTYLCVHLQIPWMGLPPLNKVPLGVLHYPLSEVRNLDNIILMVVVPMYRFRNSKTMLPSFCIWKKCLNISQATNVTYKLS